MSVAAKWLHGSRCHLVGGRHRPGDFVLDGHPAPPPQKGGGQSPLTSFDQLILWPNGWMHRDASWYGGRPQPRGICVRWGHSSPPQNRGRAPNFWPIFIVAKRHSSPPPTLFGPCLLWPRLPISATAELLLGRELGPHLTQIPLG